MCTLQYEMWKNITANRLAQVRLERTVKTVCLCVPYYCTVQSHSYVTNVYELLVANSKSVKFKVHKDTSTIMRWLHWQILTTRVHSNVQWRTGCQGVLRRNWCHCFVTALIPVTVNWYYGIIMSGIGCCASMSYHGLQFIPNLKQQIFYPLQLLEFTSYTQIDARSVQYWKREG